VIGVGSKERYVELSMGMEVPEEFVKNFVPIPKEYVEEAYRSDEYLVFIGPQHPGSGHMRIILRLKGDYIVDAIPDPGYVHRGVEKLAETRLYIHILPLIERPTIQDSANFDLGYSRAVEKLADLDVPKRAQYIRVILAELSRIAIYLDQWVCTVSVKQASHSVGRVLLEIQHSNVLALGT